jgi:hypothetical protein
MIRDHKNTIYRMLSFYHQHFLRTSLTLELLKMRALTILLGKCLLRNDMRNFVISKDKIHFLEVLNLNSFLNYSTKSKSNEKL